MAVLDALDASTLSHSSTVASWLGWAREAVEGIVERGSLAFQRAAVQDAFRATLDAWRIATEIGSDTSRMLSCR